VNGGNVIVGIKTTQVTILALKRTRH